MNSELETKSTTLIHILLIEFEPRFCNVHLVKTLALLNKFQVFVANFLKFYLLHFDL